MVPIGTLVLGKYLDQWLIKRPKLIVWLGHSSVFNVHGQQQLPSIIVHTHAIVIRNAGRKTANEVRIGHHTLPDNYQLYPAVPHTIDRTEGGIADIVIPKLVPGEQITVSYLYLPPLIWSQIHAYTKSAESFAKEITVLPTPRISKWLAILAWMLIFSGTLALLYLFIDLLIYLFR